MEIATQRLKIIPLSLEQFELLIQSQDQLEKELGLNRSGERMGEHMQKAMEWLFDRAVQNKEHHPWYTNWQIILTEENLSIGSACFMGKPNAYGEAELSYGINERHRGKGFMTEAAAALYQWALEQPGVGAVTAVTEKGDEAARRVLQKCGLKITGETNNACFWKIKKDEPDEQQKEILCKEDNLCNT